MTNSSKWVSNKTRRFSRRLSESSRPCECIYKTLKLFSPALKIAEEKSLHDAKLAKMQNEMSMVFAQKVQEKEQKLKQSEEELYARHREMKAALEAQRLELEEKKRRLESGAYDEKATVRVLFYHTHNAL